MVTLIQNAEALLPVLRAISLGCAIAAVLLIFAAVYLHSKWDLKALSQFVKENKPVIQYETNKNTNTGTPKIHIIEETIPQATVKKLAALLGDGQLHHCEGWNTTSIPATTWQNIYQQIIIAPQPETATQTPALDDESKNIEGVADHD